MKTLFLILFCFLHAFSTQEVCGQEYKTRDDLLMDLQMDDTDVVIMNGERYLINKSFLRYFKGYKALYPEIANTKFIYDIGQGSEDYKMNYQPYWVIKDSAIYLVGILIDTDGNRNMKLPEERFVRMEKLTGAAFKKGIIDQQEYEKYLDSKYSKGVLFGDWINGEYYIKPVLEFPDDFKEWKKGPLLKPVQKSSDYIREWKKSPILKLTIKKGHIVRIEKI